ncbi:hypothetical protein HOY80DRAFT_919176 [Tuber brumale]|nr:hypothetical protein HOY80DRAFT_919176 [Tuber brumale]
MGQFKTAEGTTLYAHKSILDSGTELRPGAPWDNFTTSTVERFLDYCYQGDYRAPKPAKLPLATPTSSVVSDIENDDDRDNFGLSGHPNGLDYFEVFFAHAELYILSQIQGRSSLAALCLDRLREALDRAANAPIRPRFATNLSRLLSYVYEHDNVKLIDDNQAHDVQSLALSCAAMHMVDMKEEYSLLMKSGGKIAEDLMKGVVDRAISLDSALRMEMEKKEAEKKEAEKKAAEKKAAEKKAAEKREAEKKAAEKKK